MKNNEILFNVALIEPEIPQNTGNIGRTCVGLSSHLDIVGPLGFEISNARLKRAGLDYWPHLSWKLHDNISSWQAVQTRTDRIFYFSAFATQTYYDFDFKKGDTFVFGKETKGLPESLMSQNQDKLLLLPMLGPVRGYNLATAVAIVLFEAYRQVEHNRLHSV